MESFGSTSQQTLTPVLVWAAQARARSRLAADVMAATLTLRTCRTNAHRRPTCASQPRRALCLRVAAPHAGYAPDVAQSQPHVHRRMLRLLSWSSSMCGSET